MTTENKQSGGGRSIITHKQASCLFKFTLLKFWEPENTPAPTIQEASAILEECFVWMKAPSDHKANHKANIVKLVRKFFPEWDGSTLGARFGGRKKKQTGANVPALPGMPAEPESVEPESKPVSADVSSVESEKQKEPSQPVPASENEAADQPERVEVPKEPSGDDTLDKILALIGAGISNVWLHGPAGTGKTTLCKAAAEKLGLPCTILSCNAGTSPAEITGFKYPEPRPSPVSRAIGAPGVVVFDEITMLDPSVAAVANALLANGELETSTGHVFRKCIIIATANTVGNGADRVYIGNNQLDGATLNRFACGFVEVNYSAAFESQFDSAVVGFCHKLRAAASAANLRRIISTRDIMAAHKLKLAGIDWKEALLCTWSANERAAAGV